MFNSIEKLKSDGFSGFLNIQDLRKDFTPIPDLKGVYMVYRTVQEPAIFLKQGTGGFFKGKDPNVAPELLNKAWIQDTLILYIGKAGGQESNATLRSRLKQYLKFGDGQNIGHYGGRFIWQIKDSHLLGICWKPLPVQEPREMEGYYLQKFKEVYKKLPFANLKE